MTIRLEYGAARGKVCVIFDFCEHPRRLGTVYRFADFCKHPRRLGTVYRLAPPVGLLSLARTRQRRLS